MSAPFAWRGPIYPVESAADGLKPKRVVRGIRRNAPEDLFNDSHPVEDVVDVTRRELEAVVALGPALDIGEDRCAVRKGVR